MSDFSVPSLPRRIPRRRIADLSELRKLVDEGEPVVLEGALAHWSLLAPEHETPAALLQKLAAMAGAAVKASDLDARYAGRLGYVSADEPAANFRKIEQPFSKLAEMMRGELEQPTGRSLYMQATPLELFPGLAEELPCPFLGRAIAGRIWVGTGQRVATHYDEPDNLACLVAGRKRATLFPPEQLPNLYVGPVERAWTAAGVPESPIDPANPDLARFPRFEEALAHARQADLERGDVLYIPAFWWHHMDSPGFNALVNFWWKEIDPARQARAALVHAILALRDQPEAYRARWRTLFEYYVFRASGDPYAGVPREDLERRRAETRAELERELEMLWRTKP